MRMSRLCCAFIVVCLLGAITLAEEPAAGPAPGELAGIELFNPTAWEGSFFVEVRCGDLAAPGGIDWAKVRLVNEGRDVPHALLEGTPHWNARLRAPIVDPRPEDLLSFACTLPPGRTTRISILPGPAAPVDALKRDGTLLSVAYPDLRIDVDEHTGLLVRLEHCGDALLAGPMTAISQSLRNPATIVEGNLAAWRALGDVRLNLGDRLPDLTARLESQSSTAAATELNFVLGAPGVPEIALTYRIHSAGMIEVLADGRPWSGPSPWRDKAISWGLDLRGTRSAISNLENRWPAYGFKEYFRVVEHPASIHLGERSTVVTLGESLLNGRQWHRRLYLARSADRDSASRLAEAADEGLVVRPIARSIVLDARHVTVTAPENASAIGRRLTAALSQPGTKAAFVERVSATPVGVIELELTNAPSALGLEGDGFRIDPQADGHAVRISSGSRFGLDQAVSRLVANLRRVDDSLEIPRIAGNPTARIRGGGFGGGAHEVDFPYGTNDEWTRALDALVDSGMNTIACMGMWSDWKMPVEYRHMPELQSTAAGAFDELSGARLQDVPAHRARGKKLLSHLQDRGVKVWLWIPVGCVPTTFAERFPSAMSGESRKTPNFAHPKYQEFITAFFKELLETYPVDGLVLIRDDNGEICRTPEYLEMVRNGRSKDPIWEQYLLIYDKLKELRFAGDIAVYPYNDFYRPEHESFLPDDLIICGHGSGLALLSRSFEHVAPMGDTWLDNLFCEEFALPPSPRMKRLLSDRSSFWLGGAYTASELPLEAIGYFGWNARATPNTFRYEWGQRAFGKERGGDFVRWSDAYEQLWDLFAWPLMPAKWAALDMSERQAVAAEVRRALADFTSRQSELEEGAGAGRREWFALTGLTPQLLTWRLEFLEHADRIATIIRTHDVKPADAPPLPPDARQELVAAYQAIEDSAARYNRALANAPGKMLAHIVQTRMTAPWIGAAERLVGMEWYSHVALHARPMSGLLEIEPTSIEAGREFVVRCRVRNTGFYPWSGTLHPRLAFDEAGKALALEQHAPADDTIAAYGDTRTIEFRGVAPRTAGEARVTFTLEFPEKLGPAVSKIVDLQWMAP